MRERKLEIVWLGSYLVVAGLSLLLLANQLIHLQISGNLQLLFFFSLFIASSMLLAISMELSSYQLNRRRHFVWLLIGSWSLVVLLIPIRVIDYAAIDTPLQLEGGAIPFALFMLIFFGITFAKEAVNAKEMCQTIKRRASAAPH